MIHLLEPAELRDWLAKDEVFLIDVREQSEYNAKNIQGSVLIPLGQFNAQEILKKNTKNKKIVIHCKSGGRSLKACQTLAEEEPDIEVWNLEGGIIAWGEADGNSGSHIDTGGCAPKSGGSCSIPRKNTGGCAA